MAIHSFSGLAPSDLFSWASLLTFRGVLLVVGGGFLVGFGTAYAGGCTSGHGISGIADLQPASFVALLGFFAGGIVGTFVLLPLDPAMTTVTATETLDVTRPAHAPGIWIYLVVGVLFGIVITKGEVISWFRIQEMFRFQGFHMYGVFLTALPTAIVSVQWLKRRHARTIGGDPISIPPKPLGDGIRYGVGGVLFGLGLGADRRLPRSTLRPRGRRSPRDVCRDLSAMAGTWTYGLLRPKLPH